MAREYRARLIDRDGFAFDATVTKPFPPNIVRACARSLAAAITSSESISTRNVQIETVCFEYLGVEVDKSGVWVTYEERS